MDAVTQPDLARDELIDAAMCDSLPEGRPWAAILEHHLAKRGLVIVEAARHDKLTATLQFVGSVLEPIIEGRSASLLPIGIGRALRNAVNKIREI